MSQQSLFYPEGLEDGGLSLHSKSEEASSAISEGMLQQKSR